MFSGVSFQKKYVHAVDGSSEAKGGVLKSQNFYFMVEISAFHFV
jgi:hypothetical protein